MTPREPFEVGNTVYAMGRVTTVEKVYKNGNFTLAGIDGQWRQWGTKAGASGYHIAYCEHYTEAVAERVALERALARMNAAARDLAGKWHAPKHLSVREVDAITRSLLDAKKKLDALIPSEASTGKDSA